MKKSNNGFTMIELLVTLAVLAVMITIAVPNSIAWMGNHRAKAGVNQIVGNIQKARSIAIKENRDVVVTFNGGQCVMDGRPVTLDRGVTLQASTFPASGLVWISQGFPELGTEGAVNVGNDRRTYQITVGVGGVVRSHLI